MKYVIFSSGDSWAGLILRVTIGVIMLSHGTQKMFGLFGGYGFAPTMNFFTGTMKLPWIIALMIIVTEFFCSLGLIIGLGSKLCAALFIILMCGAIITTNYQYGFFMNWFGNQKGEGFEYHLLVIGMCLALLFTGSGKYSVDNFMYYLMSPPAR